MNMTGLNARIHLLEEFLQTRHPHQICASKGWHSKDRWKHPKKAAKYSQNSRRHPKKTTWHWFPWSRTGHCRWRQRIFPAVQLGRSGKLNIYIPNDWPSLSESFCAQMSFELPIEQELNFMNTTCECWTENCRQMVCCVPTFLCFHNMSVKQCKAKRNYMALQHGERKTYVRS